jgi:hypothetical protein
MSRFLKIAFTLLTFTACAFAGTSTYQPHKKISLQGRLISAKGATPDGKAINFPALQLTQAIVVMGDEESPTEKGVLLLHMVLNQDLMPTFIKLKGQTVLVEGKLFHADNGNHQTNVLVTPSSISLVK